MAATSRQLPAVAHQGGQGVCRPSLPHPHMLTDCLATIAFLQQQLPIQLLALWTRVPSPKVWDSPFPLLCPDLIYSIYCPAGSTTCPWPVQLAAITIYLVARCQGTGLLFSNKHYFSSLSTVISIANVTSPYDCSIRDHHC